MLAWDVDNIFPHTVVCMQHVIDVIVEKLCHDKAVDVILAGNIYTTQRLCELSGLEPDQLEDSIHAGTRVGPQIRRVEFIQTERRRNAVDRVLEQRMIQFSERVPDGHVHCISNDGDFANTLGYCSYKGVHVTSIGTVKRTKNANWRSKRHNMKLVEASDDAWRLDIQKRDHVEKDLVVQVSRYYDITTTTTTT